MRNQFLLIATLFLLLTGAGLAMPEMQDLPDLSVDDLGISPAGTVVCQLRNAGTKGVPNSEYLGTVLRLNIDLKSYDFNMVAPGKVEYFQDRPVDPTGILKKPGGVLIFDTGIQIDAFAVVSVILDFENRIREQSEDNNLVERDLFPPLEAPVDQPVVADIEPNPGLTKALFITPVNQSFTAAGGKGSVYVSARSGNWTSTSNDGWLTINSGKSGRGVGFVSYSVAINLGTATRIGTMTIAGQTFTVTQSGNYSTYMLSPISRTFTAQGGEDSVIVTVNGKLGWTASSNDDWITITSGKLGTGSGMVGYAVEPNPSGMPRQGTLTIAGKKFTVKQETNAMRDWDE